MTYDDSDTHLDVKGCAAIAARKTAQGHNDKCRDRIQSRLEQDEEGRARVEKRRHILDEAAADYIEKDIKKARMSDQENENGVPEQVPASSTSSSAAPHPPASHVDTSVT